MGEEIANELVELLNQVYSASRDNLRELNELNFARFDAKLEQRVAETMAHVDGLGARLDTNIERMGTELNAKIDRIAAELNAKISGLASNESLIALSGKVDHALLVQTRWMFVAWATLMAAIVLRP